MTMQRGKRAKLVIGILLGILVAFCVISFFADRAILAQSFSRVDPINMRLSLTDADIAADYPYTDVEFYSGDTLLRGHVYEPQVDDDARGLLVFVHGIYAQHENYLALITAFVDRGWRVFAYDATGCGASEGDSVRGMPQSALDLHAALSYIESNGIAQGETVVVVGHSWGAFATGAALNFDHDVEAAVCMSGFSDSLAILDETAQRMFGPIGRTQYPFIYLNNLIDFNENASLSAVEGINHANIPVMVIHGTDDTVISYDGASISAHADKIANPFVSYIVEDVEGRNGHNSYFYSVESQDYLDECAAAFLEFAEDYGGVDKVAPEAVSSFRDSIDLKRANTADPALMDLMDAFLVQSTMRSL